MLSMPLSMPPDAGTALPLVWLPDDAHPPEYGNQGSAAPAPPAYTDHASVGEHRVRLPYADV